MMTAQELNARSVGRLPGLLGVEIVLVDQGKVTSRLQVRPDLMAANGYLHAAAVVALADTTAGYGAWAHLPEGANGFTTIELKSNFIGTAREGQVTCEALLVHSGRSTQVWDATVIDASSGRPIALFRCTQIIFYPEPAKSQRS